MKKEKTTLFSKDAWRELKKRLNHLAAVCCPPPSSIRPSVQFKFSSEFGWDDALKWGHSASLINPKDLKYIWEDRQTLKEDCVDYIIINEQKWFFYIHDKIGNFFLEDGSRKVEIEFPYWMEMGKVIKTPGVRSAVFNLLKMCMAPKFPKQKDALACFSDNLCLEIYNKNPSREAVEIAVLEMIEVLRNKTVEYLEKNHAKDIARESSFKRYLKSRTFPKNTPEIQQVREFLSAQKKQTYILAEKFNLIKNARKIFQYEEIRDHVRHPDVVQEHSLQPHKIYKDFCIALDEPIKTKSNAYRLLRFGNNIDIALHLSCLSFIWTILDQHVDPNLVKKKNKKAYYDDLIQKEMLTQAEARKLSLSRLSCNSVAHVNGFSKNARSKVMHNRELFNLANLVYRRHIKE